MGMESLDKLEERITKAIAHIEKLTRTKNQLEEANKQLQEQISLLKEELKTRDTDLAQLHKETNLISEKVREKVEGLLNKINAYEQKQA